MVGRHGGAAVSIGHPDRKRLLSPIDFKFDVRNLVNSVPARDGQFPAAEKRMERVTHGYDARVAGIIACRFSGGRGNPLANQAFAGIGRFVRAFCRLI